MNKNSLLPEEKLAAVYEGTCTDAQGNFYTHEFSLTFTTRETEREGKKGKLFIFCLKNGFKKYVSKNLKTIFKKAILLSFKTDTQMKEKYKDLI